MSILKQSQTTKITWWPPRTNMESFLTGRACAKKISCFFFYLTTTCCFSCFDIDWGFDLSVKSQNFWRGFIFLLLSFSPLSFASLSLCSSSSLLSPPVSFSHSSIFMPHILTGVRKQNTDKHADIHKEKQKKYEMKNRAKKTSTRKNTKNEKISGKEEGRDPHGRAASTSHFPFIVVFLFRVCGPTCEPYAHAHTQPEHKTTKMCIGARQSRRS